MVPLHHPWMRPDRSITHRHTQKHIPTLIDNIAVPPSVCLVGLSHHLREATPSPIQHSTPLPPSPSLSLSSISLPSYFPSFSYVWMSTDLPQDIAGSLLLNTYTSRSTSIVRPLPTPPPTPSHTHTHTDTSSALVMSPYHTQTCPVLSDVPVGQSPYIFDLHTHTISMALFIDLAPTHLILSSTLSIAMTPPSLLVDCPTLYV